jgi:anti-sigma factor (TIGR02949 family)
LPTCKDFLRELSDYLDDSLDPSTRQELDQHVRDCPNCWVVLDTTQKTVKIYKGCEPQAVPANVENRLLAALQKKIAERGTCS